ncbi:MAG TPA: deoxyribodipyrimidine photo-lyase [Solirubrobacterales bacterium]|nr:deoxyribodipyrimidine photo-lyase [Solirubrobacterales bacterium]
MRTGILWLRRDLRVRDHPALRAALERSERIVPLFCFDDSLLHGRHASGSRTQFLLECLADLDRGLRERSSGLVVRHGDPVTELVRVARDAGAQDVHATDDVGPYARRRDHRVRRALARAGIELHLHPGVTAIDVAAVSTKNGKPFTVFSPFFRAWLETERRPVLRAPAEIPPLPSRLRKGRIPALSVLGLEQEVEEPPGGGETAAKRTLDRFLGGSVRDYADGRDVLGADRTSRLSPYLHFGCVSPRQIEDRLGRGQGPEAYRRQLAWRDFHHHVLAHHPRNARSELQDRYRGKIRWSHAHRPFEAWCEGRTGFPLVDAGMRQLRREGWMHNRARLVVGSFLTKDLGIDWRWGERHFMRLLVDGDEANNNGNWQWIASVGTDPQPAFRRIYNPARHQERFDPENRYVRRYVPELRTVPDAYVHEPWTMPADVQRKSGCVIGEHYPVPVVDHRDAREEALARYRVGRSEQR